MEATITCASKTCVPWLTSAASYNEDGTSGKFTLNWVRMHEKIQIAHHFATRSSVSYTFWQRSLWKLSMFLSL